MNPTQHLRFVAREADPDHRVHEEYKRIMRATRLRSKGWMLSIRRSRKYSQRAVGRTYYDGEITITLGRDTSWPAVCALLLHEIAHASLVNYWPRVHHGDEWRSRFVELAVHVYGINFIAPVGGSYHDLQAAIQGALCQT